MTIGVFDSGIGGLSFFQELDRRCPSISRFYLGDHSNLPYGNKPVEEIVRLTYNGVRQLIDLGCTCIVVACNTASILAVPIIKKKLSHTENEIEIFEIFSPTVRFLRSRLSRGGMGKDEMSSKYFKIGIFATLATVQSEHFQKEIGTLAGTEVQQVACNGLVEIVENAKSIEDIRGFVFQYVCHLRLKFSGRRPHIIVLGCTHYSLIKNLFLEALGNECEILCQEALLIERMLDMGLFSRHKSVSPVRRLFTTGDKDKANMAAQFLLSNNFFMFESIGGRDVASINYLGGK